MQCGISAAQWRGLVDTRQPTITLHISKESFKTVNMFSIQRVSFFLTPSLKCTLNMLTLVTNMTMGSKLQQILGAPVSVQFVLKLCMFRNKILTIMNP